VLGSVGDRLNVVKRRENSGFWQRNTVIKKISATRMRGIVKMVRDTLTAAFYATQQKHAHPTFVTLQMLEKARFAVWRGALKIRVSVVRFRPRPPN
jgi:hypothetical protein